jgi:hypothetical protein
MTKRNRLQSGLTRCVLAITASENTQTQRRGKCSEFDPIAPSLCICGGGDCGSPAERSRLRSAPARHPTHNRSSDLSSFRVWRRRLADGYRIFAKGPAPRLTSTGSLALGASS